MADSVINRKMRSVGSFEKARPGKKKRKGHLGTLLLDDGGSDHLVEGIVFAFAGWCNVHGGGANVLLLEAGLEQMRHLCLLKIINRRSRLVWGYQVPSNLFIINLENYRST